MIRRLRTVIFAVAFAIAGAIAGRVARDYRRQLDAGEEPHIDVTNIDVRPQDVIPGLVAAMRAGDRPWSYLHIPAWLAAFAANFAFAAFHRELAPLRRMAGLHDFPFGGGDDDEEEGLPREGPITTTEAGGWTTPQPAGDPSARGTEPRGESQAAGFTAFN